MPSIYQNEADRLDQVRRIEEQNAAIQNIRDKRRADAQAAADKRLQDSWKGRYNETANVAGVGDVRFTGGDRAISPEELAAAAEYAKQFKPQGRSGTIEGTIDGKQMYQDYYKPPTIDRSALDAWRNTFAAERLAKQKDISDEMKARRDLDIKKQESQMRVEEAKATPAYQIEAAKADAAKAIIPQQAAQQSDAIRREGEMRIALQGGGQVPGLSPEFSKRAQLYLSQGSTAAEAIARAQQEQQVASESIAKNIPGGKLSPQQMRDRQTMQQRLDAVAPYMSATVAPAQEMQPEDVIGTDIEELLFDPANKGARGALEQTWVSQDDARWAQRKMMAMASKLRSAGFDPNTINKIMTSLANQLINVSGTYSPVAQWGGR